MSYLQRGTVIKVEFNGFPDTGKQFSLIVSQQSSPLLVQGYLLETVEWATGKSYWCEACSIQLGDRHCSIVEQRSQLYGCCEFRTRWLETFYATVLFGSSCIGESVRLPSETLLTRIGGTIDRGLYLADYQNRYWFGWLDKESLQFADEQLELGLVR